MLPILRLLLHQGWRLAGVFVFILMPLFISACAVEHVHYGPPARAHFYPHPYDYYYYPSVRVYFNFTTGYYYYPSHGVWLHSRVLPRHIYLDPRERVRVQINDPQPYRKTPELEKRYTPRPNYRIEERYNIQERDANRNWYRDYSKQRPKEIKQWPLSSSKSTKRSSKPLDKSSPSKDKKYIGR